MRRVSGFSRLGAIVLLIASLHGGIAMAGGREPRQPGGWFERLVTRIVHILGDELSVPPHS